VGTPTVSHKVHWFALVELAKRPSLNCMYSACLLVAALSASFNALVRDAAPAGLRIGVHGTMNGTGTAVVNDKDDVGSSGHDGCHSTHHTHIHVAAPQRRGVALFPSTKEGQTLPELLIGSQSLRLAALEA
jgi:hypothetical protein